MLRKDNRESHGVTLQQKSVKSRPGVESISLEIPNVIVFSIIFVGSQTDIAKNYVLSKWYNLSGKFLRVRFG